jgi:hypothetical protein
MVLATQVRGNEAEEKINTPSPWVSFSFSSP